MSDQDKAFSLVRVQSNASVLYDCRDAAFSKIKNCSMLLLPGCRRSRPYRHGDQRTRALEIAVFVEALGKPEQTESVSESISDTLRNWP
jgi:hypothetical protein